LKVTLDVGNLFSFHTSENIAYINYEYTGIKKRTWLYDIKFHVDAEGLLTVRGSDFSSIPAHAGLELDIWLSPCPKAHATSIPCTLLLSLDLLHLTSYMVLSAFRVGFTFLCQGRSCQSLVWDPESSPVTDLINFCWGARK